MLYHAIDVDSHRVDLVADVKESLILRGLLWTWARWGALQNLGYPQRAAFAGNGKMPLYSPTDCTPEVAEVEQAVCSSSMKIAVQLSAGISGG